MRIFESWLVNPLDGMGGLVGGRDYSDPLTGGFEKTSETEIVDSYM